MTKLPPDTGVIVPLEILDMAHVYNRNASPLCSVGAYRKGEETIDSKYRLVQICRSEELDADLTGRLRQDGKAVLVLALPVEYRLYREMFRRIQEAVQPAERQQRSKCLTFCAENTIFSV